MWLANYGKLFYVDQIPRMMPNGNSEQVDLVYRPHTNHAIDFTNHIQEPHKPTAFTDCIPTTSICSLLPSPMPSLFTQDCVSEGELKTVNPFTPESHQCQISPPAPPEILHHTVWRTWLFIAYSDEKWLYYKFSLHHSYNRFLKGWENTLFELRSEIVNEVVYCMCLCYAQVKVQIQFDQGKVHCYCPLWIQSTLP